MATIPASVPVAISMTCFVIGTAIVRFRLAVPAWASVLVVVVDGLAIAWFLLILWRRFGGGKGKPREARSPVPSARDQERD